MLIHYVLNKLIMIPVHKLKSVFYKSKKAVPQISEAASHLFYPDFNQTGS